MAQSEVGEIRLFNDFTGGEVGIANAVAYSASTGFHNLGDFKVIGDGIDVNDSGAVAVDGGLGGVIRLTTTNEDAHTAALATEVMFDVALMGTLVLEARVQMAGLGARSSYIGFCDVAADAQGVFMTGATTTLTLTASDLAGFYYENGLSSDNWHMVHNGGTATGETNSLSVVSDVTATAGEWDILRVEIYTNGTIRWFINGDLKQTVTNGSSTSVDLAAVVASTATAATIASLDVDYMLVKARRDWTR